VAIYGALAGKSVDAVLAEYGGQGFGGFKPALGELMVSVLAPIAGRFNELRADREALDAILARGASKAREMGAPTLAAAYRALGLVRG
jgi:tryptophanyl-tRNA synthetase